MNVTKIESRTVKTYTVRIDDGEVRLKPYSRSDSRYQVETVVITKRDGNVDGVELRGHVLKKDGSQSRNDAKERLYGQRDWPEWLRSVIGGLA